MENQSEPLELREDSRYLIFSIANEMYGTPLLDVREVVEFQQPKPVPNSAPSFLGVINIRGEIVGVIDLRIKLKFGSGQYDKNALMVFNTIAGPLAALVDQIESVLDISSDTINTNPQIKSFFLKEHLLGIAKSKDRLITLLDLNKALSVERIKK
jgi:purine-binding chemotaxis protein CheW